MSDVHLNQGQAPRPFDHLVDDVLSARHALRAIGGRTAAKREIGFIWIQIFVLPFCDGQRSAWDDIVEEVFYKALTSHSLRRRRVSGDIMSFLSTLVIPRLEKRSLQGRIVKHLARLPRQTSGVTSETTKVYSTDARWAWGLSW